MIPIRKILLFLLISSSIFAQKEDKNTFVRFVPKGYTLLETTSGDLNKDGKTDVVLIIKNTDKKNFVDEYDFNNRGIIILLKTENGYKKMVENRSCLPGEGAIGFLIRTEIKKNSLFVYQEHLRYGTEVYQFRLKGNDMQLIGYENTIYSARYLKKIVSVNFLTQRILIRENINHEKNTDGETDEEVLKDTWSNFPMKNPIFLSKIEDFDELYFE